MSLAAYAVRTSQESSQIHSGVSESVGFVTTFVQVDENAEVMHPRSYPDLTRSAYSLI